MGETNFLQIEAHYYGIGPANHNFWVLRGSDGTKLAEFHGLAYDPISQQPITIGTFGDKLHFYQDPEGHLYGDSENDAGSQIIYRGTAEDVEGRWADAFNAIPYLNSLDLPYSPFGFIDPTGVTNSNSAFRIFGELMGLPPGEFNWRWEPGIDTGLKDILFGRDIPLPPQSLLDRLLDALIPKASADQAISDPLGTLPDPLVKTLKYVDPLVLDLDGDGIELSPLSKGVLFDADADAIKTGTAWVAADDGLLVWDRDGNGQIDSGRELFGDETLLANGQKATNGFNALSELDSNANGKFDAADSQYANLRIWQDLNQDGISQANELKTLADTGVQSINLVSTPTTVNYGDALLVQSGSYARTDASTGQAGSFILAQNNFTTSFTPIPISDAAKALPAFKGSGWVRDLQEAATVSPELVTLFNEAKAAPTRAAYKDAVASLLREWGNDSIYNSASKQALSAGYGLILSEPQDDQERSWMDMAIKASETDRDAFRATLPGTDQAKFDAMRERMVGGLEKIYAYEAFTGYTFLNWLQIEGDAIDYHARSLSGVNGRVPVEVWVPLSQIIYENRNAFMSTQAGYIRVNIPTPLSGTPHMEMLWNRLVDDATTNLMPTLRLAKYLDMLELSITDTHIGLDFTQLNAGLASAMTADAHEGAALFLDLYNNSGKMLIGLGWDGIGQLHALMQQGLADTNIRNAFTVTGFNFFTDGTVSGSQTNDVLVGDSNDNTLSGGSGNDLMAGQAGNDNLDGGLGDDLLIGGGDNDTLNGADGKDILDGGVGNDYLSGGAGDDTFLFGKGDGQDTIQYDYDTSTTKLNVLQFKAGISPNEVMVSRSGNELVLAIAGTSDKVTVGYFFYTDNPANDYNGIQQVKFNDGTTWDTATLMAKAATGNDTDQILTGYNTADAISAAGGNDTVLGQAGNDTLDGGEGADRLYGGDGDDLVVGGSDNDNLYGETGNDTLDGGTGNDQLSGGVGNDTYLFGKGDGQDTIQYDYDTSTTKFNVLQFKAGVSQNEVAVSRSGNELVLAIAGTSDKVTVGYFFYTDNPVNDYNGVQQVKFNDGTTWDTATLMAKAATGNDTAQVLTGYGTADAISAAGGNDTVFGQAGNDTLDGGAGTDTVYGGEGDDTVNGGSDDDALYGNEGNDTLDGGTGNDQLAGGVGNDTYLFGKGDGQDTIQYDYDTSTTKFNVLQFKAGVSQNEIAVSRSGNELVLTITGTSDKVTVGYFFYTDNPANDYNGIQQVKFNDGTTWDTATLMAKAATGNDTAQVLTGYGTADAISAAGGNDTVFGQAGNDTLDGGAGTDTVYGGDGDDTMHGGSDDDILYGNDGNDTLDGGSGNDYLSGGAGADVYLFGKGAGQDTIYNPDSDAVGTNADTVMFGAGISPNNVTLTRSSDDLFISINGTDDSLRVQNYFSNEGFYSYVVESLKFSDNSVWDAVAVKAKVLIGTTGNDILYGYSSNDTISSSDGNDVVMGYSGDDMLDGGTGTDNLQGGDGNDTVIGGTGSDNIYGGNGNDSLLGNEDNDTLYGDSGDDTLDGGSGNDYLSGGAGADVYLFGKGSGQDTIYNPDSDAVGANADTVLLGPGINTGNVTLTRSGDNLLIGVNGTDDTLSIQSYFNTNGASSYVVENIKFADNTIWDYAMVSSSLSTVTPLPSITITGTSANETLLGGSGNDNLSGGAGNDSLDGGAGNDVLDGGAGNDTYLFGIGSGKDVISAYDTTASKLDGVQLGSGILPTDVTLKRVGDALELSINGTNDTLLIGSYFYNDATYGYQVEQIKFFDNTVWGIPEINARVQMASVGNDVLYGYASADNLSGGGGDDSMYARAGNDTLDGGAGEDQLYGEDGDDLVKGGSQIDHLYGGNGEDNLQGQDGDDILYGDVGNDTLDGGSGNDQLVGGAGNDTYLFGKGDGQDSIATDYDTSTTKFNVLQFKAGVTPGEVAVTRSGADLVLSIIGTNDKVAVGYFFYSDDPSNPYNAIQQVKFNDGTTWDIAILMAKAANGNDTAQILVGYGSADAINALGGNDTLYGNAGNDTLDGGVGTDNLFGGEGDDVLIGGTDDDRLYGDAGNDTLDGNLGNDYLSGGAGNDTYLFGKGDGQDTIESDYGTATTKLNVLQFKAGVSPDEIAVTRSGNDLVLAIIGTNDKVTVGYFFNADDPSNPYNGIQQVNFNDGTTWDIATLMTKAATGNDMAQVLAGYGTADAINAAGGNDTVFGQAGNDTLDGGAGADTLYGGEGDDGLNGGTDDDRLYGDTGNDTLDGNLGNDYLSGGAGNDTYLFGKGDGQDTIESDYDTATTKFNVLQFKAGVSPDEIIATRVGADLVLSIAGTTDKVTIGYFFYSDATSNAYNAIQQVRFSDNTSWDVNVLQGKVFAGTVVDDNISGSLLADTINGQGGADTLYGGEGNDLLNGGAGNDRLYGDTGNDTLDGGLGNDYLSGGAGNDTYLFGKGDGQDTIESDYDTATTKLNVLQFKAGVSPDEVVATRVGTDLVLSIAGTADKVTVGYFFYPDNPSTPYNPIQQVTFSDNTSWDFSTLLDKVFAGTIGDDSISGSILADTINGQVGADTLYGGDGNDSLNGGSGNDTLYGNEGEDILDGGEGKDLLVGGAGNDTYLFGKGDGHDTIQSDYDTASNKFNVLQFKAGVSPDEIIATRVGVDLVLSITGTTDKVTIGYFFYSDDPTNANNAIQQVLFSGGTSWDAATLAAKALIGTAASDNISGTVGSDTLNGQAGNDTLYGGLGNDILIGGEGTDWLIGGPGDDYYETDNTADAIVETAGDGNDIVRTTVDFTLPANVESLESVGMNAVALTGNGLDNSIWGNQGNNILTGSTGNDYLAGNAGDDVYVFNTGDGQDYIGNTDLLSAADTLRFGTGISDANVLAFHWGPNLVLQINGTNDQVTIGEYYRANTVIDGRTYNNKIDRIEFANGNVWDQAKIQVAIDRTANPQGQTITGTSATDTLIGSIGNDTLTGLAGDDVLVGGTGSDSLVGGAGDDYYETDSIGDSVVELADEGNDIIRTTVDYSLPEYVERLESVGTDAIILTGNSLDNGIWGNPGNNTLTGGAGNDYLMGNAGDDVYVFNTGDSQDYINNSDLLAATDTLRFGAGISDTNVLAFHWGDNLVLQVKGTGDQITINDYYAANTIIGPDSYDNKIDRVEFANTVVWDQAMIQSVVDRAANNHAPAVNITLPALQASVGNLFNYTVAANTITDIDSWDSITYTATLANGNPLPAWLTFNSATRTFIGTPGANDSGVVPLLVVGTDNYNYTASEEVVLAVAAASIPNLDLTGTSGADTLAGGAGNDTLTGLAGDDALLGGLGSDSLVGGAGDDYYEVDNAGDAVFEQVGEGNDIIRTTVDYTLPDYVERLESVGTNAITLTGNGLDNGIWGNPGNNTLTGGAGNDYVVGNAGDDVYVFNTGDGQDYINNSDLLAATDTLRFGAGIAETNVQAFHWGPNLVLQVDGSNDQITLSDYYAANSVIGTDTYDNKIDRIEFANGGVWNQTQIQAVVDGGASIISAPNSQNATLAGTAGIDMLNGRAGNDTLSGLDGNDLLFGGAGADTLSGGLGSDTFIYSSITDTGIGATLRDVIQDFSSAQGDKLDVKAIDANSNLLGSQPWTFVAGGLTGVAGQISFDASNHLVAFDRNGDQSADFEIELTGVNTLAAADFLMA